MKTHLAFKNEPWKPACKQRGVWKCACNQDPDKVTCLKCRRIIDNSVHVPGIEKMPPKLQEALGVMFKKLRENVMKEGKL